MGFVNSYWAWIAAYLVMGLLFCAYHATSEWLAKRRQARRFSPPPWVIESGTRKDGSDWIETIVANVMLIVVWLPALVWFGASDGLKRFRAAKEKAWRRSPEGKAEAEREYREGIEREIAPWICVDDLTRRNVPWLEFDADYQEYKYLFQRDRDIFEALMAKVQPGDEIACFSTHEETWRRMFGRAGWAIVRDGKVIAQLTTVMN